MTTRSPKRSSRPWNTCPSSRNRLPNGHTPASSPPASSTINYSPSFRDRLAHPGLGPLRHRRPHRPGPANTLTAAYHAHPERFSHRRHPPLMPHPVLDQPARTRTPNELTTPVSLGFADSAPGVVCSAGMNRSLIQRSRWKRRRSIPRGLGNGHRCAVDAHAVGLGAGNLPVGAQAGHDRGGERLSLTARRRRCCRASPRSRRAATRRAGRTRWSPSPHRRLDQVLAATSIISHTDANWPQLADLNVRPLRRRRLHLRRPDRRNHTAAVPAALRWFSQPLGIRDLPRQPRRLRKLRPTHRLPRRNTRRSPRLRLRPRSNHLSVWLQPPTN